MPFCTDSKFATGEAVGVGVGSAVGPADAAALLPGAALASRPGDAEGAAVSSAVADGDGDGAVVCDCCLEHAATATRAHSTIGARKRRERITSRPHS